VFNRQGYVGASMRDLIDATGLEKGGIYNHFGSKEQLALEAYDHAMALVTARLARSQDERDRRGRSTATHDHVVCSRGAPARDRRWLPDHEHRDRSRRRSSPSSRPRTSHR
jgi:AcrR family transcriptional regulator